MRRILVVLSCAVVASWALSAGCSGSGKGKGGDTKPTDPTTANKPPSHELDKLMRTRMNVHYSQLVFLVFHAEAPDFAKISEETAQLREAVSAVLALQAPPQAASDQARQVYVDYNETLRRDSEKFVAATARKDFPAMSTALTKMGETCSACHHFFRIQIKDAAE
jgi:cytochrome c556